MHILVYSMGTKATRRKAAVHYAVHSLSRGNLKNLMLRSFTFVRQLYCCSSKHNNNKALRITFNSCKTVSTSSMALATVSIDKIISDVSVILCIGCACKFHLSCAQDSGTFEDHETFICKTCHMCLALAEHLLH